jgi:hypothetical protein
VHTAITTDEVGLPTLEWHSDTAVIQAEEAVDGWYA